MPAKRRILIVHDRSDEVARIAEHLPAQRFAVTSAETPDEALHHLRTGQPAFDVALIERVAERRPPDLPDRRSFDSDRRRDPALDLMSAAHVRSPSTDVLLLTPPRADGPQMIMHGEPSSGARGFSPEDLAAVLRARSRRRHGGNGEISREFARLLQVAADVSSSLTLDDVLQCACRAARDLLRVSHAAILLLSNDCATGSILAEHPLLDIKGMHVKVPEVPAAKWVVEARTILEIPRSELAAQLGPVSARVNLDRVSSIVMAPISARGRILGCFAFSILGRCRRLRPGELRLCQGVATLLGVAVENTRLYHESRLRAHQLEQVRRTALGLTAHVDREELLRRIIRGAVELVDAKGGGVYSYDQNAGTLTVVADHRRPEHFGKTVRVGEGMAGRLVQDRDPYLAVQDYRFYKHRAAAVFEEDAFGSVLEVLLKWEDQIVGVLYVDDVPGRPFSAEDSQLLCMYADQAAVALATATPSEQWIQPFRAASEILDNLGVTELDQRLALIAGNAAKILNAENAGVFLVSEPGTLSLEASHGHCDRTFEKGKRLLIRPNAGLTGHIAFEGRPFRLHGDALLRHPAVRNPHPAHLPAGRCYSLVALPLFTGQGRERRLKGLLRLENKRGSDGRPAADVGFTEFDERTLQVFGEVVVIAIANAELVAELRQKQEVADRRRDLLDRLHAAVGRLEADADINDLRRQVIQSAVALLGADAGFLYINHPRVQKVEMIAGCGLDSGYAVGTTEVYPGDSLAGMVAHNRRPHIALAGHDLGQEIGGRRFDTVFAVPFGRGPTSTDGVIVVAGDRSHHPFAELEGEVLEQFATHVAGVFQARNVRSWPTTAFEQVESLRRLMTYMTTTSSEEKALAALVTGATAGYGVGFNRAAVFLVNEAAQSLDGAIGVGDVNEVKARRGWTESGELGDVERYLRYLDTVGHYKTEVDERVRAVRLPLAAVETSAVLRAARAHGFHVVDSAALLWQVPGEILDAMDANDKRLSRPMVVTALTAGGSLLGFLVADSLFRQDAFSPDVVQTMRALTQTAAAALCRLRGLPIASENVAVELGPIVIRQFLKTALESSRASSAVLWCYDSNRGWRLAEWVGVGIEHWNKFQRKPPEPGYTAYTALDRTWLAVADLADAAGAPFVPEDTRKLLQQVGVRSFQAVAVTLGPELLGVLYLNYDQCRTFDKNDRDLALALATSAALTLKQAETESRRTQTVAQLQATTSQLQATLGVASLGVLVSAWEHLVGNKVYFLRDLLRDFEHALDGLLRPPIAADLFQDIIAVDVNSILRDAVNEEKETWQRAAFDLQYQPGAPVVVRGNPAWLKHAFVHFVRNAWKALDRRPPRIEPSRLTIAVTCDGSRALIEFVDSGAGIPPEKKHKVFSAPTEDPSGFGIGLRTARTILLAYGGDAFVGEDPIVGTRICVWLPLHQQGVAAAT